MKLPPQRENEPEWLVVQRANQEADRQLSEAYLPMQAAAALTMLPLMPLAPLANETAIIIAVYGSAIAILFAKIIKPKTLPRTKSRYIINYIIICWSIFSTIAVLVLMIKLIEVLSI